MADEKRPAHRLPDVVVEAPAEDVGTASLGETEEEAGRHLNLGSAIDEVPGVATVVRGAGANEPVIRGLGWERVSTQLGELTLHGACPSRMDPPLTYLQGSMAERIVIVKALDSVTYGPFSTGGRIIVDPFYERADSTQSEFGGWLAASYESNRDGSRGELGLEGGFPNVDLRLTAEGLNYDDYESADGIRVPATRRTGSTSLSLGWEPVADHRWSHFVTYVQEDAVEYPSLPMNLDESEFLAYLTRYTVHVDRPVLQQVEVTLGAQRVDHVMSNRGKPNRAIMEAETPSETRSLSGTAKLHLALSPDALLIAGVDGRYLSRDALRTRHMVSSGMTMHDRIWPDATQWGTGAFGELNLALTDRLELRAGLRADMLRSDAAAADTRGLGGKTIRQHYIDNYGPDAEDVSDNELLAGGNLLLTWRPTEVWSAYGGIGFHPRAASVTERYFAFAPAPGGYLIGNPSLDVEEEVEIAGGMEWTSTWLDVKLEAYHSWVDNYILPTTIDRRDVNGDGTPDLVKGYRNVDAELYGGEISLVGKLGSHWSLPCSVAHVRGRNATTGGDLPEIPALDVRVAVRATGGEVRPWWVEFGARLADEQKRVDNAFPEDETPGYTLFHLRGAWQISDHLTVEASVENLFDEAYHDHLSREAAMAAGDLAAGDEVPSPGRSFYAGLIYRF